MVVLCASCAKPLSTGDKTCASCGAVLESRPEETDAGRSVPGRSAIGTVVVVGRTRQEPVVDQRLVVVTRLFAVLTAVGLLATVPVGGLALLGRALIVVGVCLMLLLAMGCVLWTTVPKPLVSRSLVAITKGGVAPLTAVMRPLTLPMRSAVLDRTVDVSPYSIKEVSGTTVICDVRGRLRGAAPSCGDMVEVYGRRTRMGTVLVRQFVDRTSGATLPVRMPTVCVIARLAATGITGLWAVALLGMAFLLIFGW